jgi:hypothetical protein
VNPAALFYISDRFIKGDSFDLGSEPSATRISLAVANWFYRKPAPVAQFNKWSTPSLCSRYRNFE